MKRKIREKLERMGVAFADGGSRHELNAVAGFADLCVVQMMEKRSFTVKDLATMFEVSDDWVLKTFKNAKGRFRQGSIIRFPYESVKTAIRSKLNL